MEKSFFVTVVCREIFMENSVQYSQKGEKPLN